MQLVLRFVAALVCALAGGQSHAQFGVPWTFTPKIVIVGALDDPRAPLVHLAVAYWNSALELAGSGFRLPPPVHEVQAVPGDALRTMSQAIVDGTWRSTPVPAALQGLPGDLSIVLADAEFVSFASPFFDGGSKRVVGLKGMTPPMSLPNVARNVIAHEIGHAIGMGHNSDPQMLMCGRPAPCRPALFQSAELRMFPLTDDERRQLVSMYPSALPPRKP